MTTIREEVSLEEVARSFGAITAEVVSMGDRLLEIRAQFDALYEGSYHRLSDETAAKYTGAEDFHERDGALNELAERSGYAEAHYAIVNWLSDLALSFGILRGNREDRVRPEVAESSDPWKGSGPYPYTGKEADSIQALHKGDWQPRTPSDVLAALTCLARSVEDLYVMSSEMESVTRTQRLEVVDPHGKVRCVIGHDLPVEDGDETFEPGTVHPFFRLNMLAEDGTQGVMLTASDDGTYSGFGLRTHGAAHVEISTEEKNYRSMPDRSVLTVNGGRGAPTYQVLSIASEKKKGKLLVRGMKHASDDLA